MFRIEDTNDIIDHMTDAVIDNIRIEKRLIVLDLKDGSRLSIQAFDYSLSAVVSAD